VCRDTIEYDSFECGHVKSVFYGGENTLDNLEPIRGSCNKDMGTQNLLTYKENHFKEN
jgi:5-methylcytosine-specific restriction endonuclease McrA